MSTSSENGGQVIRFGVFEADLGARVLRKRGVRVRLQEQPFRVLEALLEKPGEVVTREELKERLWAQDEFVEFDKSLNTAVQKIRQALGDSAESPRFLETVPKVGYRFLGLVDGAVRAAGTESVAQQPNSDRRWAVWGAIFTAGAAAAWLLGAVMETESSSAPVIYELTRLTADSGLTHEPAISPDGNLVAYSSDRGSPGSFDIWVQQIGSVGAIRRTMHDADDAEPTFTPDGKSIVFTSERDGGGTYIMDALAGKPRPLLDYVVTNPRVSPDGARLAYRTGPLELVPMEGGEPKILPRPYETAFTSSGALWTRDGRSLLYDAREGFLRERLGGLDDWWLQSLADFSLKQTGFSVLASTAGLSGPGFGIAPGAWIGDSDRIVFAARLGESVDLWSVAVSPETGEAIPPLERLTAGGLDHTQPASGLDGRIVFASGETRVHLRSVSLLGESLGEEPPRLSSGVADETRPQLAAASGDLLFRRARSIWLRNLEAQQERMVVEGPVNTLAVSPDGSRFAVATNPVPGIRLYDARGGAVREICSECRHIRDWSPDGPSILATGVAGATRGIRLVDVSVGTSELLLEYSETSLWDPRFSPDGAWIGFHTSRRTDRPRQVFIAPIGEKRPLPKDDWIAVTDGTVNCSTAAWSPAGDAVYYICDPEGTYCLYRQTVDPETKQLVGSAEIVRHFHDPRWSIPVNRDLRYEVMEDSIIIPLTQRTGNIWMLEPTKAE